MSKENQKEILTLKEACDLLNCHPNTLRNWEKRGIVKCIRFGERRDRRFKRSEIEKLIKTD